MFNTNKIKKLEKKIAQIQIDIKELPCFLGQVNNLQSRIDKTANQLNKISSTLKTELNKLIERVYALENPPKKIKKAIVNKKK